MNAFLMTAISGSLMILFAAGFRVFFAKRLHKRTFPLLWGVITLRLLIPVSFGIQVLPSSFDSSALSEPNKITESITNSLPEITPSKPPVSAIPDISDIPAESHSVDPGANIGNISTPVSAIPVDPSSNISPITVLTVIWIAGAALFALYFVITYVRCMNWFSESLPIRDHEYIDRWLSEHKLLRRRITARSFDRIISPLCYGIFSPVILLPSSYGQLSGNELNVILTHEFVHIKRFDAVFKTVLTAVLCLYWFDPFVWLMYILANRDIELACDDAVLRRIGDNGRKLYANTLVRMEELKSGSAPTTTS